MTGDKKKRIDSGDIEKVNLTRPGDRWRVMEREDSP